MQLIAFYALFSNQGRDTRMLFTPFYNLITWCKLIGRKSVEKEHTHLCVGFNILKWNLNINRCCRCNADVVIYCHQIPLLHRSVEKIKSCFIRCLKTQSNRIAMHYKSQHSNVTDKQYTIKKNTCFAGGRASNDD